MEQLNAFLASYKIPLVVCLVGVILIVGGLVNHPSAKPKTFPAASLVKTTAAAGDLKVNVSGAVKTPGVFTLNSGDRIEDAIKAAGGFTSDANASYISKVVNLSQKISDGMKIYIPFASESAPVAIAGITATATSNGLVGLNSATQAQLEALPGIGPVTAAKIINGRPYTDPHDLVSKKILSAKVYAQIQSQIDLN